MLLAWPSRTPGSGPQDPKDIELELQGLQFRGDDFQTSPNAGWVLVQGPSQSLQMHVDEKNKMLRMLWYVIWDRQRLCRDGMFDLGFFDHPNELDKQGRVKNALD